MSRQNVSLSIEAELLEEAHAVAVRQERQRLEAWHDVRKLLDKPDRPGRPS
jgi:hypothetical protein